MSRRSLQVCLVILCAAWNGSAQADDLGRLFTSAAERARIDALRAGMAPQQTSPAGNTARVVVNGTLRGSNGKHLVWLNGAATIPSNVDHMTLLGDGRVELTWREGTRTLKPGQGMDRSSGEVFEYHTPVPVPNAPVTATPRSTTEGAPATPVVEDEEKAAADNLPGNASKSKAKKS